MMQVSRKWKVVVKFADREVVLWIADNFPSNVLRTVANLEFSETGLHQPISINVTLWERTDNAVAGLTQVISSTPVRAPGI